ncbi:MAG: cobaltochelatase subunit CobN [Methanobacterium sp.]|nr:cobaltochelatase subunit CobN [Methanobacterium sp.]
MKKNIKKYILSLVLLFALILTICGSATADPYVGGQNLTTTLNGTVSGGLYEDTYYGFNNTATPTNVTYNFQSFPDNAQVVSATLYTAIYSGNMQEARDVYVDITFNGQQISDEYYSSTYNYPMGSGTSQALIINDHCNRVTSDYLMWYDVTSLVQLNNIVNVDTSGSYDGRIKLITLVIAYDDGDSDIIRYWVNLGHDTDTYQYSGDYIGSTNFESTLPTGSTINNAILKVIHMSSTDGLYTFNGNVLPNNNPQGSYSGSDTWNVTNSFTSYGNNTLNYGRTDTASYYKIVMALLTVKYTEPANTRPDLFISDLNTPDAPVVNQSYNLGVTINNAGLNNAGAFAVKLYDNNLEVGSQVIGSLSAATARNLNFNWTPSTTGSHILKVVIDTLSQVNESDETNNELSKTTSVDIRKPDLVATNLTVPNNPLVNQTYQLTATITNSGLADAGTFIVKLFDGSTLIDSKTVAGLLVGNISTVIFNWKPTSNGTHTLKLVVDTSSQVAESDENNNQLNKYIIMDEDGIINIFIISDVTGTNVMNMAAQQIISELGGTVKIQLRNPSQVDAMTEDELRVYLDNCDIFIGEWISTNNAILLSNVLSKYPEVANKQNGVFIILEPPVSTTSSSISLMRYSTINGVKILQNYTDAQLMDYYQNTTGDNSYTDVTEYLETTNYPELYNIATLYKKINDPDNLKNQVLWTLNLVGMVIAYEEPTYAKQESGIYRYRWYTLEEYKTTYFKNNNQGTVGLIESTKYVDSQMLQTYYSIIESLEAQGLNVIPVTAYGATTAQLDIMVKAFTSAPDYASFIANPSNYEIYVDSIVEMPAYGLGGGSFDEVVTFLSKLNVPVVRAIHSDVITNEQWELQSTGLPTDDGSKWWHIAILEAQGIIEYSFVGGKSTDIDPNTGAEILGYDPQEENIEYMTKRVASWVRLQYMDNSEKLISLIYYNYPPGKQNIGSSYLDTITSIYNLLIILKNEGYNVENIPANPDALEELMITLGINVASWAPGELQKLADNPNVILYPVSDYLEWFSGLDEMTQVQVIEGPIAYIGELCKKAVELNYTSEMALRIDTWYSGVIALVPDNKYNVAKPILDNIVATLKNYIVSHSTTDYNTYLNYKQQFFALNISGMNGWGEAPGDIMVVTKNGVQYFVIPGLKFGNIFIGPEPQRGWEGDISKLYHSSAVAPPHQYLAYFAYLQEQGTDAMVYMGRHATHEWLPGKELVLSPNDLPSVMVGTVPQIYYYIVDGLAEGEQAKRRGYAVIITHLTPPMTFTSLYGDLGTLATLTDDYDGATSTQKTQIISQVKSIINTNHYDLGVDITTLSDDELMAALEDYLEGIQITLYPYGLHAIGQKWSDDEVALLVTSILSVEFKVANSTESTTLHDEISQIMYGKSFANLTVLEKQKVQEKCVDVVKSLIYWDVDTIANTLTSNPSTKLKYTLQMAEYYISAIDQSVENEVSSLLNALNGGYIIPGAGGDPVANPDVLPTGTNFFDDQAAEIPTKQAYEYAKVLTLLALADITDDTEKIAMGIWCVETARDDGSLVSVVLYLLGMKPDWSDSPSAGINGQKLKEMPIYVELDDLVRPDGWAKKRIDVTIITSGLFRDLYSRQAQLLDNAFRVALARSYYTIINNTSLKAKYGSRLNTALDPIMKGIGYYGAGYESLSDNFVALHWVEDFEYYMSLNMTPEVAGEMAITRIFAPPEGDYGAGISKAVSESWTWQDRMELGEFYINRMGNMYSHNNWGTSNPIVFSHALSGIGTVFTSRNTNLYGVLDNDDFFDYWGGLSMAIEYVNGQAPNINVLDYANRANPNSISLEQYMNRELTTRDFNPDWIQGMMNSGYGGARYMSKFTSNLIGWQMTRPDSVQNWMWDKVVDVYLKDSYNLGVTDFLNSGNNAYALISMTGTMLTAAYEGYWTTDQATLQLVAQTWAQAVIKNGVACCDCSCGNIAMMKWATQYINPDMLAQLNSQLYAATGNPGFASSSNTNDGQSGESGGSSGQGSSSEGTNPGEQVSAASTSTGAGQQGKAYEISEANQSSSQNTGMPIAATIGVIVLVCLVGLGYFRGKKQTQ